MRPARWLTVGKSNALDARLTMACWSQAETADKLRGRGRPHENIMEVFTLTMTRCLYCGADITLPREGEPVPSVRDNEAWQELAEEHYQFCEWVLTRAHRIPRTKGFAMALGFDDYAALCQASESIIKEGDVDWYVTKLSDGRWAAWDDAELSLDRVMYFSTRGEAVAYHLGAYAEKTRHTT